MNNNITNLKRIPFVPKMSREFKPMKHYLCETDTSAKLISRKAFMRQLAQQPCPKGQVFIDFDDGIVYLFPFDPERAAQFTVVMALDRAQCHLNDGSVYDDRGLMTLDW